MCTLARTRCGESYQIDLPQGSQEALILRLFSVIGPAAYWVLQADRTSDDVWDGVALCSFGLGGLLILIRG